MPSKPLSNFEISSAAEDALDARFLVDISLCRQYQGQNPVGIVRVEREIARVFLRSNYEVSFFYFDSNIGTMIVVSWHQAASIIGEHQSSDNSFFNSEFIDSRDQLCSEIMDHDKLRRFLRHIRNSVSQKVVPSYISSAQNVLSNSTLEFFDNDVVISAGLVWDANYFEILYNVKQKTNIFVVQILYDIVPVHMPEFCVPGMNVRFPKFLLETAWTADLVYCISDSTLLDIKSYYENHKLPMPDLHRIKLGSDSVQGHIARLTPPGNLQSNKFVLYVSTIEPRKNHITLFHVWRNLYQTNRNELIPLVIVGRHGWNSGDLVTMIKAAEHLFPDYIKMMMEVPDAELEWLYQNARFTVYPSLYEGWGLPVAESLARGKFCIASNTSSVPEAASGFADLIDPLDLPAWTRTILHFLANSQELSQREAIIKAHYREVSWAEAMEEFLDSLTTSIGQAQAAKSLAPER